MSPQPTDQPPINGHTPPPTVRLRQEIRDRWGRPYELLGRLDLDACHFTLHTTAGRQVGQLVLNLAGTTGRLVQLQINDDAAPWLPAWLKPAVLRLFPHWSISGHRGRGLGALLIIYALKTACDLKLGAVVVPDPVPTGAQRLLRDLGFELARSPAPIAATYHISHPTPR
jgi:hypothetical protein